MELVFEKLGSNLNSAIANNASLGESPNFSAFPGLRLVITFIWHSISKGFL